MMLWKCLLIAGIVTSVTADKYVSYLRSFDVIVGWDLSKWLIVIEVLHSGGWAVQLNHSQAEEYGMR